MRSGGVLSAGVVSHGVKVCHVPGMWMHLPTQKFSQPQHLGNIMDVLLHRHD